MWLRNAFIPPMDGDDEEAMAAWMNEEGKSQFRRSATKVNLKRFDHWLACLAPARPK